jgi:hypothetical protein
VSRRQVGGRDVGVDERTDRRRILPTRPVSVAELKCAPTRIDWAVAASTDDRQEGAVDEDRRTGRGARTRVPNNGRESSSVKGRMRSRL